MRNLLLTNPRYSHGLGRGVGRSLGIGFGLGVGVGRIVAVGVAVAVGVGDTLGVDVAVGVAVAVGDGVGVPPPSPGAKMLTGTAPPSLKKKMPAALPCGGRSASNRKLYNVAQRIALAFWFCANVSVLHVIKKPSWVTSHGVLL